MKGFWIGIVVVCLVLTALGVEMALLGGDHPTIEASNATTFYIVKGTWIVGLISALLALASLYHAKESNRL